MSLSSSPKHVSTLRLRHLAAGVLGALAFSSAALAASASADIDAQYKKEMAACTSGTSNQDRATCIREAGAARDEARRNRLADGAGDQYQKNALARCESLPASDRAECVARMKQGTTSGSVEGGGVIREHRTVVPATR